MFETIKNLLGIKTIDFAQLVQDGAIILDVRTTSEFGGGHIKGSVNVPLTNSPNTFPKSRTNPNPSSSAALPVPEAPKPWAFSSTTPSATSTTAARGFG